MTSISGTSKDEQIIYYYIKKFFPDAINRHTLYNDGCKMEVDIFIPCISVAIEYDGYYWHKDKYEKDIQKNEFCKELSVFLIRVRETGLEKLPSYNGVTLVRKIGRSKKGMHTDEYLTELMHILAMYVDNATLRIQLSEYEMTYDKLYRDLPDILSVFYPVAVKDSFAEFLEAKYWDYSLNGRLVPENIPWNTDIKVWLKGLGECRKYVNVKLFTSQYSSSSWETNMDFINLCPLLGNPVICDIRANNFNDCKMLEDRLMTVLKVYFEENANLPISFSSLRLCLSKYEKATQYLLQQRIKNLSDINQKFDNLCITYSVGRPLYLGYDCVNISEIDTILLMEQYDEVEPRVDITFNAYLFDTDDAHRKAFLSYCEKKLIHKNPSQRGVFINNLFWHPGKDKELSYEMKKMLKILLEQYTTSHILPYIEMKFALNE